MSLNTGKVFIFLSFLILWANYSPTVSAQSETREQISPAESQSKTLETEIDAVSEKSRFDETTNAPNAPRINDRRETNIFIYKGEGEVAERKSKRLCSNLQTENDGFAYHFPATGGWERQIDFKNTTTVAAVEFSPLSLAATARSLDDTRNAVTPDDAQDVKAENFRWRSAIGQMLTFLAIQHGYAFTQPKTREALKGKFFKDYIESVKSLHGWDDGGRFFTNYIAHPMQGSFTGFIYVQNDPKALKQQFGMSGDYWRSRLKAMAWSAAWSTQFEIGPVSQASIGNVGLKGKQTWEDIVVTPTLGTAMLIAEDAIDRFLIKRIERRTDNFYVKIFSRSLLNPTRTVANLFRFKVPWYRDRPVAR
jgi:hypothetical protein